MAKYNRNFDLSRQDLELIEAALRNATTRETSEVDIDLRAAHELLGRLHNQKIFYRPKDKVYISG
jgi:hypothetical protein